MPVFVKDIMSKKVVTIDFRKNIKTAGELMSKFRRGCLIVTKDDRAIGILTDSDLIKKLVSKNLKPSEVSVSKLMSKPLVSISPNLTALEASRIMKRNNIKRLPVVEKGRLTGIISVTDIAATSPEMLDVLENRLRSREAEPEIKEETTSGICESCDNYSTDLKFVNEQWLCETCREEPEE